MVRHLVPKPLNILVIWCQVWQRRGVPIPVFPLLWLWPGGGGLRALLLGSRSGTGLCFRALIRFWKGVCRPASSTNCSPIKEDFGEVYFLTGFEKCSLTFRRNLVLLPGHRPQSASADRDKVSIETFSDRSLTSSFQMYLAMSRPELVSSVRGWQVERGAGTDKVRNKINIAILEDLKEGR